MKKPVKITLAVVAALIIIVALVFHLVVNSIAKTGIEKGGKYALGVGTRVGSVSVGLLRGKIAMDNLTIDNPTGYASPQLMTSGHWDIGVKTGSLFTGTVDVPTIELNGLDVNIELKGGTNNISDVMNNIKQLGSKEPAKSGKKVKIDSIVLRNVTAHLRLPGFGGKSSTLDVKVPVIQLKNVGSDSEGGVLIGDVVAQVFPAVVASILQNGKGIFPPDLLNNLTKDVAGTAQALGSGAAKVVGQAGSDAGKAVDNAGQPLKDAAKGAGDAIDDLFGKKKPQE